MPDLLFVMPSRAFGIHSLSIHIDSEAVLVVSDASLFMTQVGMAAKHASVCVLPRLRYFNIWFLSGAL
jgi:hypothetical protein